jgi:predicted house-cleaning noncanonical NTP pyrophosphatase (MazG superfamily)
MSVKTYNKLVRDNIIDIIINNGGKPSYETLTIAQCLEELNKKLLEEVMEYLENKDITELADIEEVKLAILKLQGISNEEFENIRLAKVKERGAFEKRIFLKDVIE